MPIWTVHAPPAAKASAEPADDLVFVREGFSWGAFLVPPIWTLRHGLWLATALWLAADIAISLVGARFGAAVGWPLWLGFVIWFGLEARNFRRAKLERCGWEMVDIVDARRLKDAEHRFFEKDSRLYGSASVAPIRHRSAPPPLPPSAQTPPPPPFGSALPAVVGYVSGEKS
jgi:hypothetical protein